MKLFIVTILVFLFGSQLQAQVTVGTISGTVYEALDSTTVMPFTKVWVETESGQRGVLTDENGRYKIDVLKPGTYNVKTKPVGYKLMTVAGVVVNPDNTAKVNVYCGNMMPPIVVFTPIIIPGDIPRIDIPLEDIEHSPFDQNPLALISAASSDIQMVEGSSDVIIRGSRPGDAIYYVDGVKTVNMASVPGVAIGALEAYTGGVPAKYGDTTGGVIVLETKSYFDLYNAWKYRSN